MAHDVFLSYCQKDKATADAVCRALEQNSVRVWMAPRNIPAGANWSEAIPKAIAEASALVLVFSAGANSSSYIPRELAVAAAKNKPIITIRLANVAPSDSVDFFTSTLQWIDAFPPPLDAHLNNLVRMTRSALGKTSQIPVPVAKSTPRGAGTGPSVPAKPPTPVEEAQPKQAKKRGIVAVAAVSLIVMVGAVASVVSLTSGTAIKPGTASESGTQKACASSDCSNVDSASDALPGLDQPQGFFTVLAGNRLQVGDRTIQLAGLGTILSRQQVSSLDIWMHNQGNTVFCQQDQSSDNGYDCYVGNDHLRVADFVKMRGWATQNASAQN